ncbi:MAG: small ribosomal subunit Rsm22 family protein [Polyangiaceae bacterium]
MSALPSSLELRARLDSMAVRRGWPVSSDVARLSRVVASLSAAYNTTGRSAPEHLPARLGFWLPRDLPKVFEATRELRKAGLLSAPRTRVRVLDIGAGLGASTLGLLYALRESGCMALVSATLVDEDAAALAIAKELLLSFPNVEVRTMENAPSPADYGSGFDFVVLSQVLSELDREDDESTRAEAHASLLGALGKEALAPSGSLIVVEPALRDRTRHLHRVRAAVLARGTLHLFAPCLHTSACPALALETDWCHEDRPIDLPEYLVPVAKSAGLRWEGLTFSFLVLRHDEKNARELLPASALSKRVVGDVRKTKGKNEALLCGDPHEPSLEHRLRYQRLDRDETEANAAFAELERGDLVSISGDLTKPGRIGATSRVERLEK